MRRVATISLAVALIGPIGGGKNDLSKYSLGSETYPNYPDCKQAYFKGKAIPGVFLKKLVKADGERLKGVACHEKTFVIDSRTGSMTEGKL